MNDSLHDNPEPRPSGDPRWLTPCPPGCSWHNGYRDPDGGSTSHEVPVYSAPGGVVVGFNRVDTFGPNGVVDTSYEYWFDAETWRSPSAPWAGATSSS